MTEQTPQQNRKKNFFSEWLEQLQQESWQLELLISGLALFGIWESRGMIRKVTYYLDVNYVSDYSIYAEALEALLWSGWAIFLVNLLIHIIIRGLWIGAIGLRYVSGDIDFSELNYSDVFKNYLKKRIGSFDDYIERLEKLSSVLFSFTFLLFFMFLSFVMVNVVFGIFIQIVEALLGDNEDTKGMIMGLSGLAFYGVGILVLIDFISLGAFKKVKDKTFATIYLWIYRFYSTVSLSFIYRPLLLNFIDDKYTRRLFFLAIPYVLFILVGFRGLDIEGHSFLPTFDSRYAYHNVVSAESVNWRYYDDLRIEHGSTFNNGNEVIEKFKIRMFSLSSYKVEGDLLEFFITYRDADNKYLKAEGLVPFRERGIRHKNFARGRVDNPALDRLDSLYLVEYRLQRDVIKDGKDVNTLEYPDFAESINYWKTIDKKNLDRARTDLKDRYKSLREQSMKQQLKSIKAAILGQFHFQIDDTSVDILSSNFYTHPNMHERGLLCYISIKDLEAGLHDITFSWSDDQRGAGDIIVVIPFLKK